MNKKVLLIAIILVVVLGAAAVYFFVIAPSKPKEPQEFFYSPGDAFVTNLGETEYLVKAVVVLATSEDKETLLTTKNAVIRDCILNVLRSQTKEQLDAPDSQAALSSSICSKLNVLFNAEYFTRVYFTDLVIQ